ncbi:hypothetical protein R6Q59_012012 [Mikania micrantha]
MIEIYSFIYLYIFILFGGIEVADDEEISYFWADLNREAPKSSFLKLMLLISTIDYQSVNSSSFLLLNFLLEIILFHEFLIFVLFFFPFRNTVFFFVQANEWYTLIIMRILSRLLILVHQCTNNIIFFTF